MDSHLGETEPDAQRVLPVVLTYILGAICLTLHFLYSVRIASQSIARMDMYQLREKKRREREMETSAEEARPAGDMHSEEKSS